MAYATGSNCIMVNSFNFGMCMLTSKTDSKVYMTNSVEMQTCDQTIKQDIDFIA